MTATAAPPAAPRQQPLQAKRIKPARWRDARLAAGIVMLLAAVLIGARLIGAADRTSPFIAITGDLPAGHVLVATDLEQIPTRLTSASELYIPWSEARKLVGRTLSRGMARHELVPLSAVADKIDPGELRDVPIVVDGLRAPKLRLGDLVDIYATTKGLNREEPSTVEPVVLGAEVVGEPPSRDSSVKVRIVVRVPKGVVEDLVRATQLSEIDVIERLPASQR